MNNSMIPFVFNDALVRVHTDEDGNPWFVAKDVCRVLDLENNRDAISTLDDDEKITVGNPDGNPRNGVPHQLSLISESGLYALVFRSRKPEAKRFRKWVTAEVLPTLRRTGMYRMESRGAAAGISIDDLPDDLRYVKPRLRERALGLALQAARIAGISDLAHVHQLFVDYCRVICCGRMLPDMADRMGMADVKIREFVNTELAPCAGGRLFFADIYKSFRRWWASAEPSTPTPSQKAVSQTVAMYYHRSKSSRMIFRGVVFAEG